MSETITLLATKSVRVKKTEPDSSFHSSVETISNYDDAVLVEFGAASTEYQFRLVEKANIRMQYAGKPTVSALSASFGRDTTYSTQPSTAGEPMSAMNNASAVGWQAALIYTPLRADLSTADAILRFKRAMQYGVALKKSEESAAHNYDFVITTADATTDVPRALIELADSVVGYTLSDEAPASGGFVLRTEPAIFSWTAIPDGVCLGELDQTNCLLQWRVGDSDSIKSVSGLAGRSTVTIPANTFPSTANLQWRVVVTSNSGITSSSVWQTVTTIDDAPSAVPVSPVGIVIDATVTNRFSWQHIISTGTPQSKADLQWSADGTTWNTLATVTGENQYYDVPANKFTSGTKYWRVRTYNTDGTPSEWSDKAEFIAINAPSAPSIVIQSTGPRPRITWQTSEQEAYQLTLSNGYASGTVYGTEKAWRSPVYLADGSYTVRVRVQNKYGMWSEWSAAALPVSHTEGEAITLSVDAANDAALTWQTAGSYDFYLVERDGVAIARTVQKQYIDHTSIGSVTYRVRGCYADSDNYGVSNSDTAEILPETNMICDLETGVWLEMRLSETQLRTNRTSFSAGVSTVHLAGLAYPVEERSEHRDRAMSVACAWPHAQRAAAIALEALVGRLVCIKDRYGNMAIGSLPSLESNCDEFMRRYSFTISHTNREEAITLDP